MECAKNNCNNTSVIVIPYLDNDGVIHKIPLCNDCKKLPCFSDFKEKKE